MSAVVALHPGFPLLREDYAELIDALASALPERSEIVVAHSYGTLEALRVAAPVPTFLLAASDPGKQRPARPLIRWTLRRMSHTPLRGILAVQLRRATYHRYGIRPPAGEPLTLLEAAIRLGERVLWTEGGHLFPIARPAETAELVRRALSE